MQSHLCNLATTISVTATTNREQLNVEFVPFCWCHWILHSLFTLDHPHQLFFLFSLFLAPTTFHSTLPPNPSLLHPNSRGCSRDKLDRIWQNPWSNLIKFERDWIGSRSIDFLFFFSNLIQTNPLSNKLIWVVSRVKLFNFFKVYFFLSLWAKILLKCT